MHNEWPPNDFCPGEAGVRVAHVARKPKHSDKSSEQA